VCRSVGIDRLRTHSTKCFSLACFSVFLILYIVVGRTPWTGDQPVARPLPTHRTTQTQNKHKHPGLQWDSNSGSQCWSTRRHFML
jgi:hypothetical protein